MILHSSPDLLGCVRAITEQRGHNCSLCSSEEYRTMKGKGKRNWGCGIRLLIKVQSHPISSHLPIEGGVVAPRCAQPTLPKRVHWSPICVCWAGHGRWLLTGSHQHHPGWGMCIRDAFAPVCVWNISSLFISVETMGWRGDSFPIVFGWSGADIVKKVFYVSYPLPCTLVGFFWASLYLPTPTTPSPYYPIPPLPLPPPHHATQAWWLVLDTCFSIAPIAGKKQNKN